MKDFNGLCFMANCKQSSDEPDISEVSLSFDQLLVQNVELHDTMISQDRLLKLAAKERKGQKAKNTTQPIKKAFRALDDPPKPKPKKTMRFEPETHTHTPKKVFHCSYCHRVGHLIGFCFRRIRDERRFFPMSF
ncbi:hypothetical protein GUJ93_ZPchr0010g8935 [Zizania palustris]|uniref:Uncharacterized protein n=1 Tax=Zizania palustris TaxID=103762 RepID=A0A8J5SZ47_ZIZPA|nr:hypothetical protein GUJ93_ZPchr0010g8935 [Zizania palustris]